MRKLSVYQRDLLFALAHQIQETAHYLDIETGEVIPVFSFNRNEILALIKQNPARYIRLVPQTTKEGREMIQQFIATVSRADLKARLSQAISTGRIFSQFRAVLMDFPEELKRWHQFRIMVLTEPLKRKLLEEGIELVLVNDEERCPNPPDEGIEF